MARVNRREVLAIEEIQVVHCVNRCVRRAFLCGVGPLTCMSYEHRRQWIRRRIEFLAGQFGIDVRCCRRCHPPSAPSVGATHL